jgi:hypothetical protein
MHLMTAARLRFLVLALTAAVAACSAHGAGSSYVPQSDRMGASLAAATSPSPSPTPKAPPLVHAPCAVPAGLGAPLHGALKVETAFGQLLLNTKGTRFSAPFVLLGGAGGQHVYAAQSGTVTYYPNLVGSDGTAYGRGAIITNTANTAQTLYAPLDFKATPKSRKIAAGAALGIAKGSLYFQYASCVSLECVLTASKAANPCGIANDATGTISVIPAIVGINTMLDTFKLDGTAFPTSAPGGVVGTPLQLSVPTVVAPHTFHFLVKEFRNPGDAWSPYYIVLCGNVAFASGPARYAGPFQFLSTASLPNLIFFRDPGAQGASLTAPLPVYGNACPAPLPANLSNLYAPIFNERGQSNWGWWCCYPGNDTMNELSSNPAVVTVTPSSVPILPVAPSPSNSPSSGDVYVITAASPGIAKITSSFGGPTPAPAPTPSPIIVTVNPTPSPAPAPTPMPNSI